MDKRKIIYEIIKIVCTAIISIAAVLTAAKEKPNTGEIIAVGTGKELEGLKVGDKVVYEKYGLTEIKDGEERIS